ncbi:streptococcal hemagglutinin [Drosophila virilis]|uniref:MADF domain-containing protein n=1 Tax=Drosophila virilis TaxID=7244 RepID=B4LIE3_DROVI|nr:flocculation protein FLO11 [Drosophila virilis]XP_032291060.1 flocculation protein FLO11 [Drosophila virilis]EDW70730.1 uncharacterized protein Dvir_GJ13939 [Drosophila virilis]
MSAFKSNAKLCRAIENQPILYDQSHEHYRKRLPSENCWDLVASEVGESVEKCKRRWRQIRNDYVRWTTSDEHRHRNGLKRPAFYLAEELKFLKPHLSLSDAGEQERESPEPKRERDSKSKSKEPTLDEYKGKKKDITEAVEEQPLAKLKQAAAGNMTPEPDTNKPDKDKSKIKEENKQQQQQEKEKEEQTEKQDKDKSNAAETDEVASEEENSSHPDDKELSEGTATPTTSSLGSVASFAGTSNSAVAKQPEFFIKQSNTNSSSNCLIIGKKPPVSPATDPLYEQMAEDSPDETASVGGGRRLRRAANRIKQLPIQKAAAEQRLTRLQRRKSMTIAAANSLRSSTSPVKMTPVPRASLPANATQAKTHAKAVKPSPKPALPSTRDDIFPRPRSTAPTAQQLVLARRPGPVPGQQQQQQQQQQHPHSQAGQTTQTVQPRHHFGVGRPPGPARLAAMAAINKRPLATPPGLRGNFAGQRAPAPVNIMENFKQPPTATSNSQPQQQQQQQQQRLVSSSNTLVISTTNCAASSNSIMSSTSSSTPGSSFSTQTASITASPIVSTTPPVLTLIKRCERGNQTECQDIFSDEHFLDMVRPQMKEMNPRQKMHFKQKIFQALMETFDDATDFPNSGEVQHFNINTPSGFDHVSDGELRLIRELVSMVSAAKHTSDRAASSCPPAANTPNQRMAAGKPPSVVQRIFRPAHVQGATAIGDDKKLYRILQMNNHTKIVAGVNASAALTGAAGRKDSIDSNSSSNTIPLTSGPSRVGTFIVPGSSPKTPRGIVDPLEELFSHSPGAFSKMTPTAATSGISSKPVLVRQMGRRYSVCGAGGPSTALASASTSPAAAANAAQLEAALLKRRMAPASQTMVPPPQRPRYSQSPVGSNHIAAIAPGNSLLMRSVSSGGQKQPSPTGGGAVPQKTPQIASIQGSAFNEFATPTSVRSGNSSGSVGSSGSTSISPLKRSMIVANVKGNAGGQQQKPSVSTVRSPLSAAPVPIKQSTSPSANVANLLADSRAQSHSQSQSQSQSQPLPRPAARQQAGREDSEMAGIIAADDFDMGRLKREPQDIMDDQDADILGM